MNNPGRPPPNNQARMQVQYVPPNPSGMAPGMMNQNRMPHAGVARPTFPTVSPENVFQFVARFPALQEKVHGMDAEQAALAVNRIVEQKKMQQPRGGGHMQMRGPMMQRPQFGSGGPQGNFHPMMNPSNQPHFHAGQPPPRPLGGHQQPPVSQLNAPFPGPGPTAQNPSTINPRTPQQPGSNQPVPSVQSQANQIRNPGSIQPPGSQQTQNHPNGPSPMVQPVPSVGNPATPSQHSVVAPQVVDTSTPEYKRAAAEFQSYKEPMLLLLDKMKIDNHPSYHSMVKILEAMDGTKAIPIDVMAKLINSVKAMQTRYDITQYARQIGVEIRRGRTRFPKNVDPYAKYANERIGAPKQLYEQALAIEKSRAEHLYLKRKATWFSESNFTPGNPEYPYPSIVYNDVNASVHLERLNAMYNNGQDAFFVEEHKPTKVKLNLEANYIVRMDKLVNLRDGKEVESEAKEHQDFDILPDKETLHYDDEGVLIQTMPSTSVSSPPSDEPLAKKRRRVLDQPTGESIVPIDTKTNDILGYDPNFYSQPVFDIVTDHKEPTRDCRYNCCVPYYIESIQGKRVHIPQAAATELRRYRHRADKVFQPLSEYATSWAVIINPTKANAKYPCPELRIVLNKYYPGRPATYEILRPNPLNDPSVNRFYDAIEEKMLERRKCDISLHSITDIVSAFRFCVEYTYRQRDVVDFRSIVLRDIE